MVLKPGSRLTISLNSLFFRAALLQKKGRFVVNENQLLQLFGSRCPLCDSNIKMEKSIHGGLIIVKRQCLQCKYRHQWKSLIGVNVQGAEGQHLSYESKLISEVRHQQSGAEALNWI